MVREGFRDPCGFWKDHRNLAAPTNVAHLALGERSISTTVHSVGWPDERLAGLSDATMQVLRPSSHIHTTDHAKDLPRRIETDSIDGGEPHSLLGKGNLQSIYPKKGRFRVWSTALKVTHRLDPILSKRFSINFFADFRVR